MEICVFFVENVLCIGGYFGLNLGVVELMIVLYCVFFLLEDFFIFDIGYQFYVYKLFIGCQDFFGLWVCGGLVGYFQCVESLYDVVEFLYVLSFFSWVDGVLCVFIVIGCVDCYVVVVVGDGVFIGGMIWEVLNNIFDDNDCNFVIVVNDNGCFYVLMIGGMLWYFNCVRMVVVYKDLYNRFDCFFCVFGFVGWVVF